MKHFLIFIYLIQFTQQQVTKTYTPLPLNTKILNPERGFYVHTEVLSNEPYDKLDLDTLKSYRITDSISIVLRVFYLENFINSPISEKYLTSIKDDLILIRTAGLKCIVRFAYSNSELMTSKFDSNKTQILSHLAQIKPILVQNSDIIFVAQAGWIGAWGEWYYTNNFGYPTVSTSDLNNRKDVLFAFLSALPSNRMIQIRTPTFKRKIFANQSALTKSEAFNQSNKSRVGHHNDCFLASEDDYGTYENKVVEYPYLASETLYTPMGGETCNPNSARAHCKTALEELSKFHWTYLNSAFHPTVLTRFKTEGCYTTIFNKLGYRFELSSGTYPTQVKLTQQTFNITLRIKNVGFASLFNERSVYLVLRNSVNSSSEFKIKLKTDPRFWLINNTTSISESLNVPSGISSGNYKLYLSLPDSSVTLNKLSVYSIRLATQNVWESSTGYNYLLHYIKFY